MPAANAPARRRHDRPDGWHAASEPWERQLLAGVLDLVDRDAGTGRDILDGMTADTFLGDGTADVFTATALALTKPVPAMADVAAALRAAGHHPGDQPYALFIELLDDRMGTGWHAARLAREAADQLWQLHARRKAVEAAELVVQAGGHPDDLAGLRWQLERLQADSDAAAGRRPITFLDCSDAWRAHDTTPVVPTGLGWFDSATEGGLPVGGITALVAYPQVGKSALALQLTLAALLNDPELRAVWALGEMTPQALARRATAAGSTMLDDCEAVTMQAAGDRTPAARHANARLCAAMGDRLSIVPAPLTLDRIEDRVVATGARLVVIDYVQLVRAPDETADRVQQLDQIIGRIRDLAITRECAIVAISSMAKSAGAASRIGQLAKGSGEIDYAVDLLYLGDPDEIDGKPAYRPDGTLNVTWRCRKARNIEPRDLAVEFDGKCQTFGVSVPEFEEFARFAPR